VSRLSWALLCWALLCCPSLSIFAQPGIGQNGVVNQASLIPTTLAGGSIAHGAAFTIRGVHFGSAAAVSVRNGKVTTPIRVLAVQPEKIEALMPDTAPLGPSTLVVTAGGASSKPFSMEVSASNPGIFSQNKNGWGPGQIENIDSNGKRTINSTTHPATPGQRVAMKITGLGKGSAAMVVVGNRTASGVARPAAQTGEQEISFAIPPDAPPGCYVPLYLLATPTRASNVVTITIQSAANRSARCDSGPIPSLEAKRVAMVVVTRTNWFKEGVTTNKGELMATFAVRDLDFSLSPLLLLPPPGTCTAYTATLESTKSPPITISDSLFGEIGNEGLAAGTQLVLGRDTRRKIVPWDGNAVGYYHGRVPPRLLNPGKFFLSGPGGIDVSAFRVTAEAPVPFEWTDREKSEVIARDRGLPLHWRGKTSGHSMILLATNVDQITTAIGTCLCTAPLNATHFEIPAAMLANIPASYDTPGTPYDQVFISSLPAKATPLSISGIGAGALFTIFSNGRGVQFH
jgi:uncharacterized protein (TIGR03437 family)